MESEGGTNGVKRKFESEVNDGCDLDTEEPVKGICVRPTRPSKTPRSYNVRTEHRGRLSYLLGKLVRLQNWKEASGVLSVLLKGTSRESSPLKNQTKYSVAMEVLNKIEGSHINPTKIKRIYEIWMRKNGAMRKWPAKDKYSIQLEFVLFCLTHGHTEEAHQIVICLMQEQEYGSDPVLNMMVGLIFYELWYSSIPEEMKLKISDTYDTSTLSEISGMESFNPDENSDGYNTVVHDMQSPVRCDSNTSVGNGTKVPIDINGDMQGEHSNKVFEPQGFYIEESADVNGNQEAFFSDHGDYLRNTSIFYSNGLDATLLPVRLPHSNENLDDSIYLYRDMFNDYYTNAVKHLRFALHSTPPVLASLLPLIQLLLLGDQVKEALTELETFCHNSNTLLLLRLRASLLESFDSKNSIVLSTCYEDILKRDPTCSHSLAKLITMHKNGDYSLEPLLEMIASHLDATYAAYNIWGELTSCFLKLSQYEEDQMSVHGNVNDGVCKKYTLPCNTIPKAFIQGRSRKSWRLRCRWWSTRHFSKNTCISEMEAGDLQLLTFKAACASHMYGPEFLYVVSVGTYLQKEKDQDKIMFLQMHIQNSVRLCENLITTNPSSKMKNGKQK